MANVPPPEPNADCTEAPIGTEIAVPIKNTSRTSRALPLTAFAAQVNVDHAIHRISNRIAASPAPSHVG